ncbi:MAG: hypothetical protein VX514_06725, partial [Candidatus Thermoplasmatota archaeon]|nr:hypothetical protein [Candidatus Thermoplasmatota archaeon]
IMYSARGGLGMGSVKEEGEGHLDPVKVLEVTGFGVTTNTLNEKEIHASDEIDNLPPTITELEEENEENLMPLVDETVADALEKLTPSTTEESQIVEEIPRKVSDVRFPIFGSDLQMEITGGMVSRIASVVATGNPGFVPIIRIDDAGVVSVQWESTGGSNQSE